MQKFNLKTQDGVILHNSTKVFEGTEKIDQAQEYARKNRSYVFPVFAEVDKGPKRYRTFYGYGIPK